MTAFWHAGERALQERANVAARMAEIGPRVIRGAMPDQHRELFAKLPFILAGSQDPAGNIWASLIGGVPGFVSRPDAQTLRINARPVSGDPLAAILTPGLPLGLLGIELPTARRNRANGHVLVSGAEGFTLAVVESFGNCPKYITRRDYRLPSETAAWREELTSLEDGAAQALITAARMFFVASTAGPGRLADVSHRGGAPGFVKIEPGGVLTIPDYAGNFFFNTLGNILLYPHAGLLFPDFLTGDVLQLSGAAWLVDEAGAELPDAERLWRFRMTKGHWLRGAGLHAWNRYPMRGAPSS